MQNDLALGRSSPNVDERVDDLETLCHYASHSLRSPLGAILNLAIVLKEDYAPILEPQGRENLDRMMRSAGRAVAILDSLLVISAMARETIAKTPINVRPVVEDVFRDAIAAQGDRAIGQIDRTPTLIVGDLAAASADARMIRIVFAQLISNALKSTRDRADSRIEVRSSKAPNETVFTVADNGTGLDAQTRDRLFSGNALGAWRPGSGGLGLAIVERIVRQHGGRIWLEDGAKEGATFSFALPNA